MPNKLRDLEDLEGQAAVDPQTGAPYDADASMLHGRLKVYRCRQRVAKPSARLHFSARCFADLLLAQAGAQF